MNLAYAIERGNNNYNLIRLFASLMVIFGHSFVLFNPFGAKEPIEYFLKSDYTGSLAVIVFFFFSGIYITHSYINSQSNIRFIIMRIFRIWPAFLMCLFLTVFIFGPILSTNSNYLFEPETYRYLFKNGTLLFVTIDKLPGVFINNYLPFIVNGSLWTLPIEVRCYGVLFIAGTLGCFKRPYILIILIIMIFIFWDNHIFNAIMLGLATSKLLLIFLFGSLSYIYKEQIILDYRIAFLMIIICIVSYLLLYSETILYITLIYSLLTIGASNILKKIKIPGDYSYGIYIYGFLVQQIFAFYFPSLSSYKSMFFTIPITILIGILSWHFIEKISMSIAKDFAAKVEQKNISLFNPNSKKLWPKL
ncbi:MAG: acyltransferase [Pedobacter sp.]|nr:MAG: acyltransferase [Pedobacter sp.]